MTRNLWTAEEDAKLLELYYTHSFADISSVIGRTVSAINNRCQKLGLKRTKEQQDAIGNGCFKKGHKTWNAGMKGWQAGGNSVKTRFKKGQRGEGWQPIGTERVSKDGTLYRKVTDTGVSKKDWQSVHSVIYREHFGDIPEGHIVVFKDRNPRNFALDNLELISRAENMRRNTIGRYGYEYRSSALQLAWFNRKIRSIENENAQRS